MRIRVQDVNNNLSVPIDLDPSIANVIAALGWGRGDVNLQPTDRRIRN